MPEYFLVQKLSYRYRWRCTFGGAFYPTYQIACLMRNQWHKCSSMRQLSERISTHFGSFHPTYFQVQNLFILAFSFIISLEGKKIWKSIVANRHIFFSIFEVRRQMSKKSWTSVITDVFFVLFIFCLFSVFHHLHYYLEQSH